MMHYSRYGHGRYSQHLLVESCLKSHRKSHASDGSNFLFDVEGFIPGYGMKGGMGYDMDMDCIQPPGWNSRTSGLSKSSMLWSCRVFNMILRDFSRGRR